MRATHIGKYKGRAVYRFPVRIRLNNSRELSCIELLETVTAHTAAEAANLLRDEYSWRPETEVCAFGPRGGETHRYVGWESAVGHALLHGLPGDNQLTLGV